jgi:hypothetical protein
MAIFASATSTGGRLRWPAALVAGLAVVGGCTSHHGPMAASPAAQRGAARAFVAAWKRSLEGTWAVDAVFERRIGTKRITFDVHEARRPPDHLRVAGGTAEGRINGRIVACTTGAEGVVTCRDGGPAPPFADDLAKQLAALSGYFAGSAPLYRADLGDAGCFGLVLRRTILAPPYGESARFCFDARTGAPTQVEVRKRGSVDVTRATAVRAEPSAADLTPPQGAG